MIGQNMILIHSSFRNVKSFSLIAASENCPYVEAMYDPASGILAVINKQRKQIFHMLPKLDDNGQPMRLKFPDKETGRTVKEQRVTLDSFSEYYISDKEDIINFVNIFAINAESFNFSQYFVEEPKQESPIITKV